MLCAVVVCAVTQQCKNTAPETWQATKKTKPAPEAYQVPADFDKSVLGEVDLSSKDAAELSLPHCFWLRWMQLRQQVTHSHLNLPCQSPVWPSLLTF